ncbi:MAG: lipid A biosynthesis lauroyl acyltransferase [Bdellovibrio sp. ArHS]|uniref:lysophospholipid acyltransferase family protein n=1 Tax=Bdellovibrio sp. ArHS TaxID=1569284 RepID=UPI000583A6F6|nr:lysophospholipid acyltransferase family protein [Bdellovibrio sp. ArHS]KHD87819.1 MAG: lipid A biosynthesis lauroyl acyltransferase [Bdellovibrio sp. ArHS]
MNLFVRFFVKVMSFFSSLFPRSWLRKSGSWVGFLWFDVFGFRKKIVLNNLDIAFPELSEDQKYRIGRESVYNLGYNFGEFFFIPSLSQKWIAKNVVYEGWENVEKARAAGKGMFFLTLHLGNGDLAANTLVMKGQETFIITKKFKTQWFNDLWFATRGAKGVQYIDAHAPNNAFEILKALKKNAAIVFVLDQYMGKPFGVATTFFGKRTGTAYGLALFAQKTKAPVLPIYTFEGSDKKLHVVVEPAIDTSQSVSEDKDQTILNLTQSFNNKLEEIVRKHPEQWMWVHRRWKDF